MLIQDVLDLVKLRTNNVAISKNNEALIKFIYLGVSELYRIFNLSIKSEVIETNPSLSMYELRNHDVSIILGIYDIAGRELKQSDVVDSNDWEIKLINYKTFILNSPHEGFLYAVYKASPTRFVDVDDELDIPDAMIDALLSYISYMIHSTITSVTSTLGRSATTESAQYYQQFKAACQELEMQGYKIPLAAETLSVVARGFK